jgi:hypothetical protein|tara:strand:- start:873 stop:1898 length:1026 start_codon:yes stop_codon:yes gene_type:complete
MKKIIISTLAVIVLSSIVLGQSSRMGTASSTQLQVVPSARYLVGGGAAANAVGLDAAFWNPAGLARSENTIDAIFSNRQYIADIENNFFGVSTDLGGVGRVALTARTFNIGDINETTVYDPDGTGQVFTPNFSIIGASASKNLSDNTSVGINANLVRESFGRVAASGLAFDLGVQYRGLFLDDLDVGFVLKNFGQPVKYEGEGLGLLATASESDRPLEYYKIDAAAFDLPFSFDMAVGYTVAGADLGLTYTSNYYATDEIRFGASYDVAGMATVSVGYQQSGVAQGDDSENEWYVNPFDGVSFGGSLNLQNLIGMNLSVDFASLQAGAFGTNNVITLRMGL